jgi:DNA polymerase-4
MQYKINRHKLRHTHAQQIRQSIKDELNLTASAGVSINKFIAKVALCTCKSLTGLSLFLLHRLMALRSSPVEKFWEKVGQGNC